MSTKEAREALDRLHACHWNPLNPVARGPASDEDAATVRAALDRLDVWIGPSLRPAKIEAALDDLERLTAAKADWVDRKRALVATLRVAIADVLTSPFDPDLVKAHDALADSL